MKSIFSFLFFLIIFFNSQSIAQVDYGQASSFIKKRSSNLNMNYEDGFSMDFDGSIIHCFLVSQGSNYCVSTVSQYQLEVIASKCGGYGKRSDFYDMKGSYSIITEWHRKEAEKEAKEEEKRQADMRDKEMKQKVQIASIKNQIKEKINTNKIIEAARIFESNNLDDTNLFNVIQNRILKISLNKQPNDNESFNILISKLGEEKLLKLSQGNYILSSDTISGLTLKDNNTGQIVQLGNEVLIEKLGKFDRVNQFEKKIEINKIISLYGVKLNNQWNGNLNNGSISMRFFKANKKGKTLIIGGVKDIPPKKYTNVEIVPDGLKNISFDSKLDLKKGRFIFLYKIYLNGEEKLVKTLEGQEILDLDWFYF
jgi:hypothetical protein